MMTVGRIVRIDVKDSRVKTRRGIGIGATIAAIRKAYPHIKSHPNPHGNEPIFEWNTVKGTAGLIFETNHGHVSNMAGGHYPALGWIEECG